MNRLTQVAVHAAQKLLQKVRWTVEFFRDRLSDYLGLYTIPIIDYNYSGEESEIINKTAGILRAYFDFDGGSGISLIHEDFNSRCLAIEDFARAVAAVSGLDDIEIVLTESTDIFDDNTGLMIFGKADHVNNTLYINAQLLRVDDPVILEHMIYTVMHEARHLMQRKAMLLENCYGTSYEVRYRWRRNIMNYINADEDFEGYCKQILEADARAYASFIWQKACSA